VIDDQRIAALPPTEAGKQDPCRNDFAKQNPKAGRTFVHKAPDFVEIST
jgi:hypothetical protein